MQAEIMAKEGGPEESSSGPGQKVFLFGRDEVVIHRLTAAEEVDLRIGAGGLEDLQRLGGVFFGHVLAVENADELGVLLGLGVGQTVQQSGQILVGALSICFSV